MLTLREPTGEPLAALRLRQAKLEFTYPGVGQSRGAAPQGYVADRREVCLGQGEEAFSAACRAVRELRMLDLGWVRPWPAAAEISPGELLFIVVRFAGLWWTNVSRIVYVEDEPRRFGVAYGTLPEHVERGEERFLVTWRDDDSVWYELSAFSRPGRWFTWLGYPLVRRMQRRFALQSLTRMRREVDLRCAATEAARC